MPKTDVSAGISFLRLSNVNLGALNTSVFQTTLYKAGYCRFLATIYVFFAYFPPNPPCW